VTARRIEAQREIPAIDVYLDDDGVICIRQDQDSSGMFEAQLIEVDEERALLLAIALVEITKGT